KNPPIPFPAIYLARQCFASFSAGGGVCFYCVTQDPPARPSAAEWAVLMGSDRQTVFDEQAVVGERGDRREVAVVLVVRALEGGLAVGDGIENEREDAAGPGRHVGGGTR